MRAWPWVGAIPLVLLAGCAQDGDPTGPDPSPLGWESVTRTTDSPSVIIEKVTYRSNGLRIVGQVCRPPSAGPHPVMIVNHGGFAGLAEEWNGGVCRQTAAQLGYVVAESSYRGEDGSEGSIELCLGEVDDVLRLTDIVLSQPYADRRRVVMWGGSHGGCITTRAFQRGAPVHAAVDVFGPSDPASTYAFWQAQVDAGSPQTPAYQELLDVARRAAGGTPAQAPQAYAIRSTAAFAADLARRSEPFMIVHGVEDPLIPVRESCLLASRAGGFGAWHVTANPLISVPTAPEGCGGVSLAWSGSPRPVGSWPANRYLLIYDTAGHDFEGLGGAAMVTDVVSFLVTRTPPP
jgi:dienelactone hydrolase